MFTMKMMFWGMGLRVWCIRVIMPLRVSLLVNVEYEVAIKAVDMTNLT